MNIGDHDQVGFRLLTLFMLAVLVILALTRGTEGGQASVPAPAPASAMSAGTALGSAGSVHSLRVAVGEAAEKARPAVVRIITEAERVGESGELKSAVLNVGSGVVYDRAGYILTNQHVIEGAERFTVSLPDGRAFAAELVGADAQCDLAVLRVGVRGLPVAPLGDSAKLQVGEWVVAIGHALGMPGGPTVTTGVVSALGRMVQERPMGDVERPLLYDLIQTDAPINPGNSGGPLVNLSGEVVGITTLSTLQNEVGIPVQGIGFAIGIASAKAIADEIVEAGRALPSFLGMAYGPLGPPNAASGSAESAALVVRRVAPSSAADQAGVRVGDVITAIDDDPIADGTIADGPSAFDGALQGREPRDEITLTIVRHGEILRIALALPARRRGGQTP